MANIKISQLTSLSTMTDAAIIPVVDSGVTQQISGANLKTYFTGSYGNANVVANLAALGSNPISTTGNITAGNILGNGQALTGIVFSNTSDATAAGLTVDDFYLSASTALLVTNSGASAYLFDQYPGNNPTIYAVAGSTLAFRLAVTGHPFLIQSFGANYSTGLNHVTTTGTVTTAASAQGQVTGTLYWKIPGNAVGTYTYQCSVHGGMVGNIVVSSPTEGSFASLSVTGNITANNIGNISSINLSGNANTVLYGNGVFAAVTGGGGGDYGNSNVAAFLAAYGSNTVSTTGNVTSGNLIVAGNIIGSNTIVINNQASGNTADIQLESANSILLQARDRTAGTDPGGAITIQAGSSAANVGAFFNQGGDISINSGSGGESNVDYAGWGGNLFLRGGSGGNSVGASAYAGRGGSVTLLAGSAGDDGGDSNFGDSGGLVSIAAGATTSTNGIGGYIYLDTGDGGPGGSAGSLVISIPSSDQGPGGDWEFYGTGNTMYVPGNSSISQRDYTQNFSVESSGNTIITSNASSYGNSRTAQNWVFDNAGNLTAPGNISASGNVTAGNITGGNIVTVGNVDAGYFIGNGSQLTGLPAGYSNAEVAAYLPTYTGNIQAGNISVIGDFTSSNITAFGSINAFGNIVAFGNIDATNITTNTVNAASDISGGSLTTAGVTSTDSLTATATISAAGNVIGNNFNTAGLVSALGNIVTAGYFVGNFQGNITGNLSVAGSNTQVLYNGQGNAAASAGFTFDSDSNTVAVLGPVSAQGNVTGGNIVTIGNVDAGYFIGNGSQLTGLPEGYANADVAAYLPTYTGNLISLTGDVTTTANITGNFIIGNGSQLTGLPEGYGNANVAANLAAFGSNPITTTDTVTALTLSAASVYGNDIYGGNINATGTVSADYFSSGNLFVSYDGTVLGNISAGNVTATNLPTKFASGWLVPTGNSTQSFTVAINQTYQMWVRGSAPFGQIAWNSLATVTLDFLPVLGQQFAWNYEGNANVLMFNSIPNQIVGTAGAISNVDPGIPMSNTNTFSFGINNASGNDVFVEYGWATLS